MVNRLRADIGLPPIPSADGALILALGLGLRR